MTKVHDEPLCVIFRVCKVYEKQTVYVSTDDCECFSLYFGCDIQCAIVDVRLLLLQYMYVSVELLL